MITIASPMMNFINFSVGEATRKDSIGELETRAPTMDAVGRKRACSREDTMDPSEDKPLTQEKCRCVEAVNMALVLGKEVAQEHALRRGPGTKARWDAAHAAALEVADAPISGWISVT